MNWHIYFIAWVSWAGKWTLIENLKNANLKNVKFPLSYKSRPIRHFETNWVDAHFVSKEEFEYSINAWEFIEYAKVYWLEYYYGTKFKDLIENGIEKWFVVIKEIDLIWLKKLLVSNPELRKNFSTIFLTIHHEKIIERLKTRWEEVEEEVYLARKNAAIQENIEWEKYSDYVIDTSILNKEEVFEKVLDIIKKSV